jgi:serine/threonine protein kinase
MNIASPNSTTTATMTSVVATTGSSVSGTTVSSSSSGSSSVSSVSIKRWTVAKSHAAASYLHFTRPLSSSSLAGTSPPPPPSKGQHFHDQVIKSKRGQGGHQHHHHLVGSKILSSSSLVVSENSNIGTVCRSSCWQESDFAIDGLLGEGHFGKIYRAYCYPRSLPTGATTTTTTSRTGIATDGLPRELGITVSTLPNHANHPNDAATTDKTTTCSTATTSSTINISKNNTVALKRFSKDRIADAKQRGSRLTELLQREINIHSKYVFFEIGVFRIARSLFQCPSHALSTMFLFYSLQHPCIISFLGHYVDHHHLTLVLEYAPFGDLYGYMAMMEQQHQAEGGMSFDMRLETTRTVMSQMTAAVAHLQRLFVAHRDIKSENVLLVEAVPAACHSATIGTPRRPLPVPTVFKLCDFGWAVSYQGFISGRLSTLCGTPE